MKGYDSIGGTSKEVRELAKRFKENLRVTDYEAFSLAFKVELHGLLKQAFVISSTDSHPTALEKIAIILEEK